MTEQIGNSLDTPTTSLAGSITASDTSLTVASAASLPASGTFRVRIGSELITVGARSGTTLSSLGRGAESTVAAAHSLGADVDLVLTAGGLATYVAENGGAQTVTCVRFPFTFADAGLDAGIPVGYTPAVGDAMFFATILVGTAFDGTTPLADVGYGTESLGIFASTSGNAISLADADDRVNGLLVNGFGLTGYTVGFPTAAPLVVWASQDGSRGGTPIGGAAGTAEALLMIANA